MNFLARLRSTSRNLGAALPEQTHHSVFDTAVVYFTFVYDGKVADPARFCERLLSSGVAETISSPADGQVRMSPRYRGLLRSITLLDLLANLHDRVTLKSLWQLWRQAPREAARVTYSIVRAILRSNRQVSVGQDASASSAGASEDNEIRKSAQELRENIAYRQIASALQHARERDLYSPGYLDSEPYLRLTLRHARFQLAGAMEPQTADVLMMVHRSGILQFQVMCHLGTSITTSAVREKSLASTVQLAWLELAEPVVSASARRYSRPATDVVGQWLNEVEEGVRWRRFENDWDLSDLFNVYLDAVIEVGGSDSSPRTWFCYSSVFLGKPSCCHDELIWNSHHELDLASLLSRTELTDLQQVQKLQLPSDWSLDPSTSTWVMPSCSVNVAWEDDEQFFDDHLWHLLLIENYLLQWWQLRSIANDVSRSDFTRRRTRNLQRFMIAGLSEYYASELSFGTAQELVERLLAASGTDRTYGFLVDRMAQLSSLVTAERSERTASRALFAAIVSVSLAVVLGLPAVSASLDTISRSQPLKPLFAGLKPSDLSDLAVLMYGVAIGLAASLAIAWLLALLIRGALRRTRQSIRPGIEWPEQVRIVERSELT